MKSFFFVCTIVFVLFSIFNGVSSQTCPKVGLLYGIQSSGSTHTVSLLDFKCKNATTVVTYNGVANDPFLSWTFDAGNNRLYISHFTSGARTVIYSVSTNGGSATTSTQYTSSPIPRISNLEFDSSSSRIFALVTANSGQIRFSSYLTSSMSTENQYFSFPNGYTALFSSIDVTNRRYYAMVQRQSDSFRFAYVFDITLPIPTTGYTPVKILEFGSLGTAPITFYSFHADPADASFIYGLAKNASSTVYGVATLTIDTKAMTLIGTTPQPKVSANVGIATFDRFKNIRGILNNNSDVYLNAYNPTCKDSINYGSTYLSIISNPNLESVCLDPVTTKAMTTGFTTGITTGQTTGRTTGITSGITTGHTTGRTTGITTGYTTGRTTGITTGLTTGFTSRAMTTGDTTGQTTGITSGITTGETTGITTGITTGDTTGDVAVDVSTGLTSAIISTGLTSSDITSGITSGVTSMDVSTGLTTQGATDNLQDQDSERNARNKKIIIIVFSVAGGLLVLVVVGVAIAIAVKKLSAPAAV